MYEKKRKIVEDVKQIASLTIENLDNKTIDKKITAPLKIENLNSNTIDQKEIKIDTEMVPMDISPQKPMINLEIEKLISSKNSNFTKENIFPLKKYFFRFSKEIFIFLYKIQKDFFEN